MGFKINAKSSVERTIEVFCQGGYILNQALRLTIPQGGNDLLVYVRSKLFRLVKRRMGPIPPAEDPECFFYN